MAAIRSSTVRERQYARSDGAVRRVVRMTTLSIRGWEALLDGRRERSCHAYQGAVDRLSFSGERYTIPGQ